MLVVVRDETIPVVMTPVCTVVSPVEIVDQLVEKEVDRVDVNVIVLKPVVGPVTVVVVETVLVMSGG